MEISLADILNNKSGIISNIIFQIFISIILCILLVHIFYTIVHNHKIIKSYKREGNNNKFSAKRCYEENTPNNIYLVDENNKKYYRIVNTYTLNVLGYPRPSRGDSDKNTDKDWREKSPYKENLFKLSDGYTLGNEIKIYDILSYISTIKDIKN